MLNVNFSLLLPPFHLSFQAKEEERNIPLDGAKASAPHDQGIKLQLCNCITKLVSCITPVNLCYNLRLYWFLSQYSQMTNTHINNKLNREEETFFWLEAVASIPKNSGSRLISYFWATSRSRNSSNGIKATTPDDHQQGNQRRWKWKKNHAWWATLMRMKSFTYVNQWPTRAGCETRLLGKAWRGWRRVCPPCLVDYL